MTMNIPCGAMNALNQHLDKEEDRAKEEEQSKSDKYSVAEELEKLLADIMPDSSHDETIDAFVSCDETWRDFASTPDCENVYRDMNLAELMHFVVCANKFKLAMKQHLSESMKCIAEKSAKAA